MSSSGVAARLVALVAIVVLSAWFSWHFVFRAEQATSPAFDIKDREALLGLFSAAQLSDDLIDSNELAWDRCGEAANEYAFRVRTVGPRIGVSDDVMRFGLQRFLHPDRRAFIKAIGAQPKSCEGTSTYDGNSTVQTLIDVPRIGDASFELRGTVTDPSGVGLGIDDSFIVAVSGDWFITVEAEKGDHRIFEKRLPDIFARLNEKLGTNFAYTPPKDPGSRCGPVAAKLSDGQALTVAQMETLQVIHDAACRRDYPTLRRNMAYDFRENGVHATSSRVIFNWRQDPAAPRMLRSVIRALQTTGVPTGDRLVTYTYEGVTVTLESESFQWVAHSGPTRAARRTSLLRAADWDAVAKAEMNCGSLGPEFNDWIKPVSADVTGDGSPDAVVALTCATNNGSHPDQVGVFDGASNPASPRRIAVLIPAEAGIRVRQIAAAGGRVTVTGSKLAAHDPMGCPSVRVRRSFTWSGTRFVAGPQSVTTLSDGTCA
jgi:hypothetical protein